MIVHVLMVVQFSLKSELKTKFNDEYAIIKFYGEFKLAVNTLLYAVYQKTHENNFLNFLKISLPSYILRILKF